jgi:hypothetical protein
MVELSGAMQPWARVGPGRVIVSWMPCDCPAATATGASAAVPRQGHLPGSQRARRCKPHLLCLRPICCHHPRSRESDMAKIGRAQIVEPTQLSLFEASAERLTQALVPGASVDRYGRTWRIGHTSTDGNRLLGRIGFEGERQTFIWDEQAKDFVPGPTPNGLVVPFVINLDSLRVVFHVRPPLIRARSFTGALEGILRYATGDDWRVEPVTRHVSFEEWRATVSRVTRMYFHVEPPNPNWEGRPQLQSLMSRLGDLDSADFLFVAESGVQTDDELVKELVDHVYRRHYGRSTADGPRLIDGHVIETVLDSNAGETEEVGSLADVPADDPELAMLMGDLEQDGALDEAEAGIGLATALEGSDPDGESEADV